MRHLPSMTAALMFAIGGTSSVSADVIPIITYTGHLCVSDCSSPTAGLPIVGSGPVLINPPRISSDTGGAQISGSPKPAPEILAAANAVGFGGDARANLLYQYAFEVLGVTGPVTVTMHGTVSLGGSVLGAAHWIDSANITLGSKSFDFYADSSTGPRTFNLIRTADITPGTFHTISLYVDAHALSTDGAANKVYAWIDPTLSTSAGFIVENPGIGNAVPEAPTWVMMLIGFVGIGCAAHRVTKRPAASRVAA